MTDLIDMTKAELAAIIGGMTASQIKKASHADLVQRAVEASPTQADDNDLLGTLARLTPAEQHLLVAFANCENTPMNGAPKNAKVPADLSTWVWLDDRKVGAMTTAQKKGVLSSLVKKGLVTVTPDSEGDLIGFTDAGFDAVMALHDEELPPVIPGDTTPKQVKSLKVADAPKAERKPRTLDDRVIEAPGKLEDVKPTKIGSKRALLVMALQRGATIEHLMEVVGWNRDTVSSAIRTDLKAIGLGVERRDGKYYLLLPEGMKDLPLRDATTTKADALVAACGN